MSAVMSTLSMMSGGRRSHPKLTKKSSRSSGQYSDAGGERSPRRDLREQRSTSLQALESGGGGGGGGVAHLETLEAKMASIEVSLSTRARRCAGAGAGAPAAAASPARAPPAAPARELDALRTALRDKDSLIQSLKEQLCTTLSINRISASLSRAASPGGGGGGGGGGGATAALSQDERRTLEERAGATRRDADDKRAAIAALRQALDRLHVTDNIDTRIQQAELEYQLGREELQLLTLMEQARALQLLIEQADAAHHHQTLYSCVRELVGASVLAVEAECDCKSPRFGAGPRRGAPGLWVDWARDDMPLCKGDRVVEVNGVLVVSCKSAEELWRALAISPRPARLVLLRPAPAHASPPATPPAPPVVSLRAEMAVLREQASEARRAKEGLRADNLRLTHRISYLEEQVSELLAARAPPGADPEVKISTGDEQYVKSTVNKSMKNVTNISITSEPDTGDAAPVGSEVQVFQKGPDITALVANLPGLAAAGRSAADTSAGLRVVRARLDASDAAAACARSVASAEPASPRRAHRKSLDAAAHAQQLSGSSHSLDHRCREQQHRRVRHSLSQHSVAVDYHAETAAALEIIESNRKRYLAGRCDGDGRHPPSAWDRGGGRAEDAGGGADATRVKKTSWAERKTLSIIEQLKRSQRLRKSRSDAGSVEDVDRDPERDRGCRRIDGKVLENTHKSNRRLSKMNARGARHPDFESENSDFPNGEADRSPRPIDYASEPGAAKLGHYRKRGQDAGGGRDGGPRPPPPRKPLRLSLHRAQSAQSVCTEGDTHSSGSELQRRGRSQDLELELGEHRKPTKRSHGGEAGEVRGRGPRSTPKPTRKLLNGFGACEAPAADALYPAGGACVARRCSPAERRRLDGRLPAGGNWC